MNNENRGSADAELAMLLINGSRHIEQRFMALTTDLPEEDFLPMEHAVFERQAGGVRW